jgi:hypothetical protein
MTNAEALRIIKRFYRDDHEGMVSDLAITLERGETLQELAESLLDPEYD